MAHDLFDGVSRRTATGPVLSGREAVVAATQYRNKIMFVESYKIHFIVASKDDSMFFPDNWRTKGILANRPPGRASSSLRPKFFMPMKSAVAVSHGSTPYRGGLAQYVSAVANGSVVGKLTQATQLLGRIRSAVITGKLLPGERLVVGSLAETFDAGQTPVREALMRLASEGFVVQEDQRGFAVAPVSVPELIDLTQTRCEIEAIALAWSIDHGDDAWEAALLASTHRLLKQEKLAADGHSIAPGWSDRHFAFHDALVAGCPNAVLLQLHGLLSERAERYRHLSVKYLKAPRDDRAEHEALSAAALARNKDLAIRLARQHIETTTAILLAEIHSQ